MLLKGCLVSCVLNHERSLTSCERTWNSVAQMRNKKKKKKRGNKCKLHAHTHTHTYTIHCRRHVCVTTPSSCSASIHNEWDQNLCLTSKWVKLCPHSPTLSYKKLPYEIRCRRRLRAYWHMCLKTAVNNKYLTLTLLMWTKWWAPTNASKWRKGFNSAFKRVKNVFIKYKYLYMRSI